MTEAHGASRQAYSAEKAASTARFEDGEGTITLCETKKQPNGRWAQTIQGQRSAAAARARADLAKKAQKQMVAMTEKAVSSSGSDGTASIRIPEGPWKKEVSMRLDARRNRDTQVWV